MVIQNILLMRVVSIEIFMSLRRIAKAWYERLVHALLKFSLRWWYFTHTCPWLSVVKFPFALKHLGRFLSGYWSYLSSGSIVLNSNVSKIFEFCYSLSTKHSRPVAMLKMTMRELSHAVWLNLRRVILDIAVGRECFVQGEEQNSRSFASSKHG